MPCLTPYRGDSAQLLLFKIASCLEDSGGGVGVTSFNGFTGPVTGVTSFNGRDGVVTLLLSDVSAVADGRYVLKAGDTMTGALVHPDGTAALPSITFTGDLDTGIFHIGANSLGFSTSGVERMRINSTGAVSIGFLGSADLLTLGLDNTLATQRQGILVKRGGFAVPAAAGSNSDGDKMIFWRDPSTDLGFGIGSAEFWLNASGTAAPHFSFYTGTTLSPTEKVRISNDGNVGIGTTSPSSGLSLGPGVRFAVYSGANQRAGNAVLVGGTVTVANTSVTANTIILLTRKTAGGTIGFAVTYTVIAATSFTITSDNVLDTSTYSYLLIEVP